MKSHYSTRFTDDVDAKLYDEEVKRSPLYAAYSTVLEWAAQQIRNNDRVLELGCGTGNATLGFPHAGEITCVDLSPRMIASAREKLSQRAGTAFAIQDMLEYFDRQPPQVDAVVSTFAVHYLTDDEKQHLFQCVRNVLDIGGRAIFGDLMIRNESDVTIMRDRLGSLNPAIADHLRETSFWNVEESAFRLSRLGFAVEYERFADQSWGIVGIVRA
jgi:putative AdoMet-dependent methyltransferase